MSKKLHETLRGVHGVISKDSLDEAKIKQWVIMPIIAELGWDHTKPEFVPEFSVDGKRVDYALLKDNNPMVFIECKRLGNLTSKGERQLFDYAANRGVPLLILTDGKIWDFYLSMAAGLPAQRRFCRADLHLEYKIKEYGKMFKDFLAKESVVSGKFKKIAEKHHENVSYKQNAKKHIPAAWNEVLENQSNKLVNLISREVENQCGLKPAAEDIDDFLDNYFNKLAKGKKKISFKNASRSGVKSLAPHPNITGYEIFGKKHECSKNVDLLVGLIEALTARDAELIDKIEAEFHNPQTRLVAKKREDLFELKSLSNRGKQMNNGWWINNMVTTLDLPQKCEKICELAGVKFNKQFKVLYANQ